MLVRYDCDDTDILSVDGSSVPSTAFPSLIFVRRLVGRIRFRHRGKSLETVYGKAVLVWDGDRVYVVRCPGSTVDETVGAVLPLLVPGTVVRVFVQSDLAVSLGAVVPFEVQAVEDPISLMGRSDPALAVLAGIVRTLLGRETYRVGDWSLVVPGRASGSLDVSDEALEVIRCCLDGKPLPPHRYRPVRGWGGSWLDGSTVFRSLVAAILEKEGDAWRRPVIGRTPEEAAAHLRTGASELLKGVCLLAYAKVDGDDHAIAWRDEGADVPSGVHHVGDGATYIHVVSPACVHVVTRRGQYVVDRNVDGTFGDPLAGVVADILAGRRVAVRSAGKGRIAMSRIRIHPDDAVLFLKAVCFGLWRPSLRWECFVDVVALSFAIGARGATTDGGWVCVDVPDFVPRIWYIPPHLGKLSPDGAPVWVDDAREYVWMPTSTGGDGGRP